jgi:CHAT domain-containing protein
MEESGTGERGRAVLNVAMAMREAVMAVRKENRDPYSWASFVLQGAAFIRFDD